MKIIEEDILLRIFISESSKIKGKPLFEEIVLEAKHRKLAGATVLRGIMGYGADKHIKTTKLIDLSNDLPVIIEIVDKEDNINNFLSYLDDIVKDGFITMERVKVIKYGKNTVRS